MSSSPPLPHPKRGGIAPRTADRREGEGAGVGARPAWVGGPMLGIPASRSAADAPHQRSTRARRGRLKREEGADASCLVPPPVSARGAWLGRVPPRVAVATDPTRSLPPVCRKQIWLLRIWATVVGWRWRRFSAGLKRHPPPTVGSPARQWPKRRSKRHSRGCGLNRRATRLAGQATPIEMARPGGGGCCGQS